jgi:hypothetical protein
MRIRILLLTALCIVAAGTILGENTKPCELSGTWYGGPGVPYLMTATQSSADRYAVTFQVVADVHEVGYLMVTSWEGEAIRTAPGKYDLYAISYWLWDPEAAAEAGVDASGPEVDAVHAVVDFQDCDTVAQTIDLFYIYFAFDPALTIPFLSPPDLDILPDGATIDETYKRMPTHCCPPLHLKAERATSTAAPKLPRKR